MKIAFASDDGKTISAHFGHAQCFVVVTVKDGEILGKEERKVSEKPERSAAGHKEGACYCHASGGNTARLNLLDGCQAVMCLGMGPRAADYLRFAGIRPVVLAEPMPIEQAALQFASGQTREGAVGSNCCCHGN